MPWSETSPMEERIRFVLEALEGWDSMTELCARYGISRRVGYKWLDRYEREGLADRSHAPHRERAVTATNVVEAIVAVRKEYPTWGPRKLKAWLERSRPQTRWPACSTIGSILKREGFTKPRRRRTLKPSVWRPARTEADAPNRVWTADFKGEFRLGCGRLCYTLTVVDAQSRFLLECRGLPSTATAGTRAGFERVFRPSGSRRSSAPTTACRSARRPWRGCRSSRCGGSVWASDSSGPDHGVRRTTAHTSACTGP